MTGLPDHLMPFQRTTVINALKHLRDNPENGVYIGDDPGLGKTIDAIAIMDFLHSAKTVIVVPNSAMFTWEEEINKFSQFEHNILVVDKSHKLKNKDRVKDASVIILGPRMVISKMFEPFLKNADIDLLVVDEAHKIKGRTSSTCRKLLGSFDRRTKTQPPNLWSKSKYRVVMSGTPISGNVGNAFIWFSRLAPDLFKNYYDFVERYCHSRDDGWSVKYFGIKRGKELNKIINNRFFTRQKLSKVMQDLPPKVYKQVILPPELSRKVQMQQEVEAEILDILNKGGAQDLASYIHLEPVQTYRREQGLMKVEAITEYIKELLDDGIPVLLFAVHISVVEAYVKSLKKYNPVVITGAVSATDRKRAISDFQSGVTDLFIGNSAAYEAINMQRARVVAFAEDPWNADEVMQAEGRAHRTGQLNMVTVINFIVKNSIDVKVRQAIRSKMRIHDEVINGVFT